MVVVRAPTKGDAVACPVCGTLTGRVNAIHERVSADVPIYGRRVWEVADPSDGLPGR